MNDEIQSDVHDFKILLVRHGQAEGEERAGEMGPPLTTLGQSQAASVAKRLSESHFSQIYTSDLSRAYHTAMTICEFHTDTPFTVTEALREISRSMIYPGRVSRQNRNQRKEIQEFANQLLETGARGSQILLVTHGTLIRFLVATLAGVNPKAQVFFETCNTSIADVIITDRKLVWLYRINDVCHLSSDEIT